MSLAVLSITHRVCHLVTPCQTVAHAAAHNMVHFWHCPCFAAETNRCCKLGHTLSVFFGCVLLSGTVVFVLLVLIDVVASVCQQVFPWQRLLSWSVELSCSGQDPINSNKGIVLL